MNRTVKFEGKCDVTRFPLELAEGEEIYLVKYRDMSLPKQGGTFSVTNALSTYKVPPNAQLIQIGIPEAMTPDSVIAAFWFTRAQYADTRKPVFYYYKPEKTLVVFPPVWSDGDLIVVGITDALDS